MRTPVVIDLRAPRRRWVDVAVVDLYRLNAELMAVGLSDELRFGHVTMQRHIDHIPEDFDGVIVLGVHDNHGLAEMLRYAAVHHPCCPVVIAADSTVVSDRLVAPHTIETRQLTAPTTAALTRAVLEAAGV
jgi:hypothetical protein